MEAKELRIGNYVDWNGEKAIISQLLEKDVCFKCGEDCLYEDINPIKLTEEWLLKFGYWKLDNKDIHFVTKGHIIWKCNNLLMCDKNGLIIKSVHQLQNLYFALNREELIIK
jgi:hypothetical protein